MPASNTIVALSTPPGRSGIGVIRLSGARALDFTCSLLQDNHFSPQPNSVSLRTIYDPANGEILDRALITYFKSPRSFTGEDMVELSCHGSPILLLHIVDALLHLGARAADPGEFTLRSLSSGKINLAQAESLRDLIDAQTHAAVRQAARQLGGELSVQLQPIKDSLLKIIVPLESSLEFVEDDLPPVIAERINKQLSDLVQCVEELAQTFRAGRLLKEGLRITLAGRPNVGKSSLFNALLAKDRAIVTEIPGTTRDSLSELLNLQGIPVLITDTAGVRASSDKIESIGIERTKRAIADADLVVVVLDSSIPLTSEDQDVFVEVGASRHLFVFNKSDILSHTYQDGSLFGSQAPVIKVSAKTGAGLNDLRDALLQPFMRDFSFDGGFLITNARHFDLLQRTATSLRASNELFQQRASEELVLAHLYNALNYLGGITGETTSEEVLSHIFSTFCIGK
ncbi:MAG: tRNA uridine-5-carboxymethylaminomethyl(34) synthesis GTPase MnmE [Pyrinomonadaceae bacterium]|nr:tRNA uridine-5-carboxymethylaminomethyl(34) synthesis GTPase MnmE [Pyrinomonadaceae bacterium]